MAKGKNKRNREDAPTPDQLEELLASVRAGRKYRSIDADLIRSIGVAAFARGLRMREAVKATRSQLHQSAGAYLLRTPNYGDWLTQLQQSYPSAGVEEKRRMVRPILASHASTYERLPILSEFYQTLFEALPGIQSILDLACGLNPLTLPWMNLLATCRYHARDIYTDQMDFLHAYLRLAGLPGDALRQNILSATDFPETDLTLILKTIPCLEQIQPNAGAHLLDRVRSPHFAVSFPVATLSGRKKGMRDSYAAQFYALMEGRSGQVLRFDFETELLFVVRDAEPKGGT